jgi:hypothetical protein
VSVLPSASNVTGVGVLPLTETPVSRLAFSLEYCVVVLVGLPPFAGVSYVIVSQSDSSASTRAKVGI